MTTTTTSLQEILELDIANKVIYVIGRPAAGKTHIANLFRKKGTYVFHTDDHIENPEYLKEVLMKEAKSLAKRYGGGCIIDGVACYELLLNLTYQPDIIIDIQISRAKQEEIYRKERDPQKIKHQKGFYEKHLKMLNEYFRLMEGKTMPTILTHENKW